MLTVIIIAIALTVLVLCQGRLSKHRQERPLTEEPRAKLLGVQIVCGNCSGDDARPQRTYLSMRNTCMQCAGNSYVLASNLYQPAHGEPAQIGFNAKEAVQRFREKHAGSTCAV
jgi:hypothetical protein